jgi:hypothetical protein
MLPDDGRTKRFLVKFPDQICPIRSKNFTKTIHVTSPTVAGKLTSLKKIRGERVHLVKYCVWSPRCTCSNVSIGQMVVEIWSEFCFKTAILRLFLRIPCTGTLGLTSTEKILKKKVDLRPARKHTKNALTKTGRTRAPGGTTTQLIE